MCKVLDRHKRSLRALFDVYADPPGLKPPEARVLRFDDWMLLLKHLCFFDEAFQQREAAPAFPRPRPPLFLSELLQQLLERPAAVPERARKVADGLRWPWKGAVEGGRRKGGIGRGAVGKGAVGSGGCRKGGRRKGGASEGGRLVMPPAGL